jgi:hypothetical protein
VTYSLDPGAPAGATINPTSGVLLWTLPNVQTFYAITIRATDSGPQSLSTAETFTVMVFDVPPSVNAGINATIAPGTEFVRSGSFADPNPDSWTATVDYGDGSGVQPLALGPNKTFQLDHTYATSGNYGVAVTVIDSQGGQGHGYFAVQVQAPASSTTSNSTPADGSNGTTTTSPLLNALLALRAMHRHIRIPVHTGPGHRHH